MGKSEEIIRECKECIVIFSVLKESKILMSRLYNETKLFLESMSNVMHSVETILNERESITKSDVRKEIDALL